MNIRDSTGVACEQTDDDVILAAASNRHPELCHAIFEETRGIGPDRTDGQSARDSAWTPIRDVSNRFSVRQTVAVRVPVEP